MNHAHSVKTALLLGLGLALAACASDDERSLVLVNLVLPEAVSAPASVHLRAVDLGSTEVRSVDVPWKDSQSRTLDIGLFIPEGVPGPVNISAQATSGGLLLAGALAEAVALKKGGSVGPYSLMLSATAAPPTGDDGGVDGVAPDDLGSDPGPVDASGPDAGATEAGVPEVPARPEVPPADGTDAPLPADAADAAPPLSDGPAAQLDGSSEGPASPPIDAADAATHVPTWEPGHNIENDYLSASLGPSLAVDPVRAHVYAAWTESAGVRVRRWNRDTGIWGPIVAVDNRGSPQEADIGVDENGNVTLVWCQDPNGTDAGLMGAWTSRSEDGVAWSPPVRIATANVLDLRLAVARNGTARAVYEKKDPTTNWPIFTAYFDGTSWTENPQYVEPILGYSAWDPNTVLVVSATGDGILVFDRWSEDGDNRIGAITLTGQTSSTITTMNANHATTSWGDRTVAMNRKGEAIFVWVEGSSYDASLYARTYHPTLGWSSPTPPLASMGIVLGLAAALDEQGQATIVWQQSLATGGYNLVGIHGSPTGSWSSVAVIENDNLASYFTNESARPLLALDAAGNALLAWRKNRSAASVVTFGAYASSFSVATGTWSPQVQLGQILGLDVREISLGVSDQGLGAVAFNFLSEDSTDDPDAYNTFVAFYR